jgi:hypothetical protein
MCRNGLIATMIMILSSRLDMRGFAQANPTRGQKHCPVPRRLVGHSYAGAVITEATNDPKVVGLVYVAAPAPGEGESINSVTKPYPPTPIPSSNRPINPLLVS